MDFQNGKITIQVRVTDFELGSLWYERLLQRPPDFIAHENFIEWEIVPNCWLQVSKGEPAIGSGPLRIGVKNVEKELQRVVTHLQIDPVIIFKREGVPAAWCTFEDPFGNKIGFFEEY